MRLETGGESAEGITVLAQNSDPFTYFGNRPVRVCEGIEIDDGTLSIAVLRRAAQRDMGPIIARVLIERLRASRPSPDRPLRRRHRGRGSSRSRPTPRACPRPFPIQVDGDFIGAHAELELGIDPGALTIVA